MSNELNIMFVSDKDDQTNTLKSISGIDEKGNLKTAPADEAIDQNQFFKVDKNLNPFENFFKNFFSLFIRFSVGFKISNKSKTRLLYAIFYLPLRLNYKHLF